ncbi:phage holin family protein [Sphingobium sp. CR28]|uniref:phage holin family protein n=1 Tax=Sphingobium sp. CR28 TaxID=3400272 RepID=UPI003FEECBC9
MLEGEEHAQTTDAPEPSGGADESVRATMERLVAAGQELLSAELEWAKLKAAATGAALRNAAVLGILAILLALAGLTTLLFGIILALTPLIGAVFATLLVAVVTIGIALILILLARRSLSGIARNREA